MSDPSLLIVGARPNSLGEAIVTRSMNWDFRAVWTAGINDEGYKLDITNSEHIKHVLTELNPDLVVCTVGVNEPVRSTDGYLQAKLTDSFRTNVIGPMELLRQFASTGNAYGFQPKFVAISSNSARIARTGSMAYCASKAALSMALRVAAREFARNNFGVLVWGYEPGLLATVMTYESSLDFEGPLHRMEGVTPEGLNQFDLADRILSDLMIGGTGLNGCMVPYDAGEQ